MLCESERTALGLMAYAELVVNQPRASSVAVISHHTPGQEGSKGPGRCCSNKGYQPEKYNDDKLSLWRKAGSPQSGSISPFTEKECSLPRSQEWDTVPRPEQDESSSRLRTVRV
jgi:hypothetical protein